MKRLILGLAVLLTAASSTLAFDGRHWHSETGETMLELRDLPDGRPGDLGLFIRKNGGYIPVTESPLIQSKYFRESAGLWFEGVNADWINGTQLVFFNSGQALTIVDTKQAAFLLNTTFRAITPGVKPHIWAGIRYYPIGRKQEELYGVEQDSLCIINAYNVIEAATTNPLGEPFSHLRPTVTLPGMALGRPMWTGKQGENVTVAVWDWVKKKAIALTFRGIDLHLINVEPLGIDVPRDVAYSTTIVQDFEPRVLDAIQQLFEKANLHTGSNGISVASASSGDNDALRRETERFQRGASIAIGVFAASFLMMWLIRRRKKRAVAIGDKDPS